MGDCPLPDDMIDAILMQSDIGIAVHCERRAIISVKALADPLALRRLCMSAVRCHDGRSVVYMCKLVAQDMLQVPHNTLQLMYTQDETQCRLSMVCPMSWLHMN